MAKVSKKLIDVNYQKDFVKTQTKIGEMSAKLSIKIIIENSINYLLWVI